MSYWNGGAPLQFVRQRIGRLARHRPGGRCSGEWPALATHDGVTVYMSYQYGGVPLQSVQTQIGKDAMHRPQGRCSGTYPALATHDGVTVYMSYANGGSPCSPCNGKTVACPVPAGRPALRR